MTAAEANPKRLRPERLRSEATFASLCRTAPILPSSSKMICYRLIRDGSRDANHRALQTMAVVRMRWDERTRAYVPRGVRRRVSCELNFRSYEGIESHKCKSTPSRFVPGG